MAVSGLEKFPVHMGGRHTWAQGVAHVLNCPQLEGA